MNRKFAGKTNVSLVIDTGIFLACKKAACAIASGFFARTHWIGSSNVDEIISFWKEMTAWI